MEIRRSLPLNEEADASAHKEYAFRLPAADVKIVPAECGDDAGLLGAARLAFWSKET